VRRGASWTAAYHRQLTVAAVAGPVRGSVLPSESLPQSGPGGCWPRRRLPGGGPAALEGSGVVAVVDPASRHATASVAGVQQAVSTHPGSASGIRLSSRSVSGHLGRRPEGPAVGRLLSTRPVSSRLLSTRAVPGRLVSAPVHSDASISSHAEAVALGTRSRWPGDPDHRNGSPRWPAGRRRLDRRSRRPGRGRRRRSRVGQWEVDGGPGPPGWVRAAAAALAR
jgi:hypothetical protein